MIYFIATIEGTLAKGLVRLFRDNCYILRLRMLWQPLDTKSNNNTSGKALS